MGLYSRFVFPRVMDLVLSDPHLARLRRELLAPVQGEVLEIGFGTGLNLAHYPPAVHRIAAVEPNAGMNRLAERRIAASGLTVDPVALRGERLALDERRFDSVVSTWTLCSIAGVEQALAEVLRVLKPGGRFYFLEHGLSPEPRVQRWQRRLEPLQRRLADGCHLARDIPALIRASGLQIHELRQFYLERAPKAFGYLSRGVAIRPGPADALAFTSPDSLAGGAP